MKGTGSPKGATEVAPQGLGAATAQLLGALLPWAHLSDLLGWLMEILIPITGRSGVVIPSDVVIGVVVWLISALALLARKRSRRRGCP